MKKRKPLDEPFDVEYTISFSGRTISDGVPTTTTPMIRDKIIYLLEDCLAKGFIRDYHVSAQINNIETAKAVLRKSKRR